MIYSLASKVKEFIGLIGFVISPLVAGWGFIFLFKALRCGEIEYYRWGNPFDMRKANRKKQPIVFWFFLTSFSVTFFAITILFVYRLRFQLD